MIFNGLPPERHRAPRREAREHPAEAARGADAEHDPLDTLGSSLAAGGGTATSLTRNEFLAASLLYVCTMLQDDLTPPKPKFKAVSLEGGPIVKEHSRRNTGLETKRPHQWGPLGGYY